SAYQTNSFLKNTFGASSYQLSVEKKMSKVGPWEVLVVDTPWVTFGFQYQPHLRGPWSNFAVLVDPQHVKYRPLVGNGISGDTTLHTNVQDNDVDGRKDQYITEAGLHIDLAERHGIINFS
ncbi:MAG: hypothetical protein KDB29_14245, partial [Planctomycetes bacterium]|nr:hypothetical protein [Planctomycetota bacterium]